MLLTRCEEVGERGFNQSFLSKPLEQGDPKGKHRLPAPAISLESADTIEHRVEPSSESLFKNISNILESKQCVSSAGLRFTRLLHGVTRNAGVKLEKAHPEDPAHASTVPTPVEQTIIVTQRYIRIGLSSSS